MMNNEAVLSRRHDLAEDHDDSEAPRKVSRVPNYVQKGKTIGIFVQKKWHTVWVTEKSPVTEEGNCTITFSLNGKKETVVCPETPTRPHVKGKPRRF